MQIDFTKLSPKQLEVFEAIAIGHGYGHPERTLHSLWKKGYIERHRHMLDSARGQIPVQIYRYSVPIPIHIAWCQWCAEKLEEKSK